MKERISIRKLAAMVTGDVVGDPDLEITGFAPLESAGPTELSFVARTADADLLENSGAAAFLVPKNFEMAGRTIVRVADPYLAAAVIQNYLLQKPFVPKGIHERAVVGSDCLIPENVTIGPLAVIGDRVKIGERVEIGPGAVIGDEVSIGTDSVVKANVTIERGCEIGERVTVHPGSVIGSDGFGYATDAHGCHVKRPQLGIVKIGDDVEIGANCCVDRATFGVTSIKSGTKLDNLVQVGHNVVIGENSLLVAQVGLSGSTTLGRNVVFGGKASTVGHQTIGDRTMVAGKGAVHGDHPPDSRLAGTPAIEAKQWFKAISAFGRLPELVREVRRLKKETAHLLQTIEALKTRSE